MVGIEGGLRLLVVVVVVVVVVTTSLLTLLYPPPCMSLTAAFFGVTGMDNLEPIITYRAENPSKFPTSLESTNNMKEILVGHFARGIWWTILSRKGNFTELDQDGDGVIDKEELIEAADEVLGQHLGRLVVDNLMATADVDNDGKVSKYELLRVCLLTEEGFHLADKDGDGKLSIDEVKSLAELELGGVTSVDEFFESLDSDGDGYITPIGK